MRKRSKLEIVFLDLDGTLLNNDKKLGERDIETLSKLGELGIKRVFATGRSYYSSIQVLDESLDFDYLVFSSGAGIYDWKNKKMLFESIIPQNKVVEMSHKLVDMQMNFSVHFAIPENHKYHYFRSFIDNKSDFDYRNILNKGIGYEIKKVDSLYDATQFLIITSNLSDFDLLNSAFPDMKTIRASSPIDGKSIWLEVFNNDVSKAKGATFLCRKLNIDNNNTLSIGNDYNDIDLLNWSKHSYAVENAPEDIKQNYMVCANNQNNPLTDVFYKIESILVKL